MSLTEVINNADLICGLKAAVTFVECHNNALLKNQPLEREKHRYESCPKAVTCEDNMKVVPRNKLKKCPTNKAATDNVTKTEECPSKYKSPEMKMSYLHYKCFCLHRNGLQDECPLTGCKGQPACMAKPWAECVPGKYYRAKNPELYPTPRMSKKKCK